MTDYGYGTIYQRESDKRWVAAVDLPRAKGEKRQRKTFTGRDRETVELKLAAYRADNPPTEHLGSRVANMERARSLGTHTPREWWLYVRSVKAVCEYCRKDTTVWNLQQDHRIPVSRGGSDAIDNLAVACRACNYEKGTMTADEYAEWKAARVA